MYVKKRERERHTQQCDNITIKLNEKIINISYWITVSECERKKSLEGFQLILNEILINLMYPENFNPHVKSLL